MVIKKIEKRRINIVNRNEAMEIIARTPFGLIIKYRPRIFPKDMVPQYHWQSEIELYVKKLNIVEDNDCSSIQEWFRNKCITDYHIPYNNAFAFWNSFLPRYNIIKHNSEILQRMLFAATCSFGDTFRYAITRYAPRDFVWGADTDVDPKIIEIIQKQVTALYRVVPEHLQTVKEFPEFKHSWNQHFQASKRYKEWLQKYIHLSINDNDLYEESYETCYPLVSIFRQYIHGLNEFSNSGHPDFECQWSDFLNRKDNCLLYSFQKIMCLLKRHTELAEIAPIFVLLQFQKRTKSLYASSPDRLIKGKLPISAIKPKDDIRWELFKKAQTNRRVPSNVAVFAYLSLCKLFHSNSFSFIRYDESLCDYMMQFICNLIGQRYYDVTDEQFSSVFKGDRLFSLQNLDVSDIWVHQLLQKIDARLSTTMDLYPRDIPRITEGLITDSQIEALMPSIRKMVDDDFLNNYLSTLVYSSIGLGNPQIPEEVMKDIADLFDKTLQNSEFAYRPRAGNRWDSKILCATEQCFHRVCNEIESSSMRHKLIFFLQNYLLSKELIQSDSIFLKDRSLLKIRKVE